MKEQKNSIRHRASSVVLHEQKLLTVEAIDPSSGVRYLFLPGGKIEESETAANCSIRETLEETGYEICLTAQNPVESYYEFYWDGRVNFCHTLFFAAKLLSSKANPKPVQDADYLKGVRWIPVEQISKHFAYSEAILQAVQKLVQN